MTINPITPVVTTAWLRDRLGQADICVVDCRFALGDASWGRQQYAAGHIPGAYYLDLNDELASPVQRHGGRHPLPDLPTLVATLQTLGIQSSPPTHVIVYDDSRFAFAARLWWLLRYLGHESVSVLDGGWAAWQRQNYPVSALVPEPLPGNFQPQVQTDWVIDRPQVQAYLAAQTTVLVDARSPERYRGEVEPIDPIAGHIPGATNLFWQTVTTAEGQAHPPAQQQHRWQTLELDAATPVVHYCGSGVTACVNVLSRAIAGLPLGQLYVGSWSDWCSYLVET